MERNCRKLTAGSSIITSSGLWFGDNLFPAASFLGENHFLLSLLSWRKAKGVSVGQPPYGAIAKQVLRRYTGVCNSFRIVRSLEIVAFRICQHKYVRSLRCRHFPASVIEPSFHCARLNENVRLRQTFSRLGITKFHLFLLSA